MDIFEEAVRLDGELPVPAGIASPLMPTIENWVRDQAAVFLALRGRVVGSWQGVEMAVRGGDEGEPEYDGPDVPNLQLLLLDAVMVDGAVSVGTYQNDCYFGIWAEPGARRAGDGWGRGYRRRALTDLPTGPVQEVSVYLDGEILAEVSLRIADREVLLVAGESEEGWSGELTWRRLDESVLVFTDPAAVAKVRWVPGRGGFTASGDARCTRAAATSPVARAGQPARFRSVGRRHLSSPRCVGSNCSPIRTAWGCSPIRPRLKLLACPRAFPPHSSPIRASRGCSPPVPLGAARGLCPRLTRSSDIGARQVVVRLGLAAWTFFSRTWSVTRRFVFGWAGSAGSASTRSPTAPISRARSPSSPRAESGWPTRSKPGAWPGVVLEGIAPRPGPGSSLRALPCAQTPGCP